MKEKGKRMVTLLLRHQPEPVFIPGILISYSSLILPFIAVIYLLKFFLLVWNGLQAVWSSDHLRSSVHTIIVSRLHVGLGSPFSFPFSST